MTYEIEKNVRIPENAGRGRNLKYPFDKMDIGDSFLSTSDNASTVRSSAHLYGKRHGMRFASNVTSEGLRIWRIA